MTGIVIAMKQEAEPFLSENVIDKETLYGVEFYKVSFNGRRAVIALCGIGKVNASFGTALLISRYNPDTVISVGVSGGLGKDVRILDLVAAENAVQYDVDTSPLGDPVGFVSTVERIFFPADKDLFALLQKSCNATQGTRQQHSANYDLFYIDSNIFGSIFTFSLRGRGGMQVGRSHYP